MRTIYIDLNNHCHVTDDGTMTPMETGYFNGKCDAYIEGYCAQVKDGCTLFYPWRNQDELDRLQWQYAQAQFADMENAITILLGGETT